MGQPLSAGLQLVRAYPEQTLSSCTFTLQLEPSMQAHFRMLCAGQSRRQRRRRRLLGVGQGTA